MNEQTNKQTSLLNKQMSKQTNKQTSEQVREWNIDRNTLFLFSKYSIHVDNYDSLKATAPSTKTSLAN